MHHRRFWIYALLVSLVMINYIDRSALALVIKDVAGEFHFSPVQVGYLFSSFLWTYALCLLPIGILIDRYSTKSVTAIGIALWSLAIIATSGIWGFSSLLATRLVMGVGESTSIPSCGRIVREWMPARERGMASVIYSSGSFLGPALGAVLVASVSSAYGWRTAFILLGVLGFLWLICHLIWFDRPEKVTWLTADERNLILAERGADMNDGITAPGGARVLLELLKSRSMWGIMIAQAGGIYTLYLLLFWLPSYLQTTKGLSLMSTGLYTAVPWAIAVPLSIALGALSDRTLTGTALLAGGRRFSVLLCQVLAASLLLVPFADNIWVILALFTASLTGIAAAISLNVALVTDLFHQPRDVGKAIAMTILSGNLFGLLAPIITGYVVAGLKSYDWAFGIAGILLLIGATTVGILARQPILIAAPRSASPLPATG